MSTPTEITGRRLKLKEGDEITHDEGPNPEWMPAPDWMIGALANEDLHYNGWRVRRPSKKNKP